MAFRLTSAIALVLLPATLPTADAEGVCAKAGENCIKKGCCSTSGTACYRKTKKYAGCLPVDKCKKGVHEKPPYDQPWTCELLTWGCNDAYNPCEGAAQQDDSIVPCCQWGCVCNYTSKYYHQCVPPEGQNHCSKDGLLKKPKFDAEDDEDDEKDSKKNKKKDADKDSESGDSDDLDSESGDSNDLDSDDEPEEEEDLEDPASSTDADKGGNCFDMGNGKFVGPDCPQSKVELRNGGSAVADAVSRLPWLAAGALAAAILVASATMVARRRQWRGAGHHMLQVDPEPFELDAETS